MKIARRQFCFQKPKMSPAYYICNPTKANFEQTNWAVMATPVHTGRLLQAMFF